MKKLIAIILVLVMCLSLVACGGPDRQPAIDAYNTLADNYNEFAAIANEDLSGWAEEDIDFFNDVADLLNEYAEQLDSDEELTQEELDEMVAMFDELNVIIEQAIVDFGG